MPVSDSAADVFTPAIVEAAPAPHVPGAITVSPVLPRPEPTLAELIAEVMLAGKSIQTKRAYRIDLRDFLVWRLGQAAIDLPADPALLRTDPLLAAAVNAALHQLQLTTEADIQLYIMHLQGGLARTSINRRLTPLRQLFNRLHRYHLIAVNPMEFIKSYRMGNDSATIWLSKAEARALETACTGQRLIDLRDHALIVLMLSAGIRSSEVLGITVNDFARSGGHHIVWVTVKGGTRKRIKLKPRTRDVLMTYRDAAGITDGPLFRRVRRAPGQPKHGEAAAYTVHDALTYDGLRYVLRTRFRAAELDAKLTPHSLRHSFATLSLQAGASLPKVQGAMGHADPKTTMRYAHAQDDLDDNAVDYVEW